FTQSALPYRLLDGTTVVAVSWADLTDGTLAHAIDLSEMMDVISGEVWTGSTSAGAPTSDTCVDWTSKDMTFYGEEGLSGKTDIGWTLAYQQFCNRNAHLYCFEQ